MDINDDFMTTTLALKDDYEGTVVATLVSAKQNSSHQKSVLYIHGYVDYFFQTHTAEAFLEAGYNFYAVDLRKHGRSLMEHQHPNYCRDIREYYEEITLSIEMIKERSSEPLYLLGHSTGGLIASNYMIEGDARSQIEALILNSPFLEIKFPHILKRPLYFISEGMHRLDVFAKVPEMFSAVYGKSVHKDFYGEWDYDLTWKPIHGFDIYYSWMAAIIRAQYRLHGVHMEVPILLMHAERSSNKKQYSEEAKRSDTVLVVKDMRRLGVNLGKNVTLIAVNDGMHDLFLSKFEVRTSAFTQMFSWLQCH